MDLWTDDEALVHRIRKLKELNPVSVYIKNDHNIYVGMHESMEDIKIGQISHICGHQDKLGCELNHAEKLNILMDELATRAIDEFDQSEVEWDSKMGPILEIDGSTITNKEGMHLSIAAEKDEFKLWQREKLKLRRSEFSKIDWHVQHEAMAGCNRSANRFAVRFTRHWLPSGKRLKMNSLNDDDRCPLCSAPGERSTHFLRCKHRSMEKSFTDVLSKIRTKMCMQKASMTVTGSNLENLILWRRGEKKESKIGRSNKNEIG